jgi:hypothetical protein
MEHGLTSCLVEQEVLRSEQREIQLRTKSQLLQELQQFLWVNDNSVD